MILGKVESGKLSKGDSLMLMPNKVIALVETVMFIFALQHLNVCCGFS